MTLQYTPEAVADLGRLREFIGQKNPLAARKAALELLSGIDKLKSFPRMGLPVSRAPDPQVIRDLFIGQYTVRYHVLDDNVTILRVWHDREDGRNA